MSLDQINDIGAQYHCYPAIYPNYEQGWACSGFEGANFFRQEVQQSLGVSLQALPPQGDIYPVVMNFIPTPQPPFPGSTYAVVALIPSFFILHELAHRLLPFWAISLYHYVKFLMS